MTDETRSHSGVRIDDRGWGLYLDIPLACPENRERYTQELPGFLGWHRQSRGWDAPAGL